MSRQAIEFVNNAGNAPDPIGKAREASFKDITTKEEYRNLGIKFSQALTWIRFLPSIKGSSYDWMMGVDTYQDLGGITFASPTTFDRNNPNLVEQARLWFRQNNPAALYNKDTNPHGIKLWTKRHGLAWCVVELEKEGERLRLFSRSLYDGSRGGTTGLAYNIRREADSMDNEPGSPTVGKLIHGDITAPDDGRLVKVEKLPSSQSEYANYKIGIGKNPMPIGHFMGLLTEAENNLITPLERTVHIPTDAEQKEALRRYIGDEFVSKIFGNVQVAAGWAPEQPAKVQTQAEAAAAGNGSKDDEPETVIAAAPAPAAVEPVVAQPAAVAEPVIQAVAQPATPAPAAAADGAPYTIKEVTAHLRDGEAGVKVLLANRNRLNPQLLGIVLESAEEYNIPVD